MKARHLLPLVGLLAAGCGGGGVQSFGSRLVVKTLWPTRAGRVIPAAAGSIKVQVLQGATVVNEALLTPAAPSTTFSEVPVGAVTVKAVAYPTAGGTGTAMASGSVAKTIAANATANVDLTMASTIDRIVISPNPINFLIAALVPKSVSVTAYDVANNVVLTAPTDISWSVSNGSLLSLSATTGNSVTIIALGVGNATVTATDVTSGKSGSANASIL